MRTYISATERIDRSYDLIGVGIGPFNLSLAALLDPVQPRVGSLFFDQAASFAWHPGLLFDDATVQVSYLKDLVTLADPTSPYSFLAFLSAHGRLYRFITANFARTGRWEFNQYFQWVASLLPNLAFECPVESVTVEGDDLAVVAGGRRYSTRTLVLGSGLTPNIPECALPHIGPDFIHASRFLHARISVAGRRVAVVGGGQTGAEIMLRLLADADALPREVCWISRRPNFLPMDDSPFTNELFTPGYSNYFFRLEREQRMRLLDEQKLASDGISMETLVQLYQRLYQIEFNRDGRRCWSLRPGCKLEGVRPNGDGWTLGIICDLDGSVSSYDADVVIFCTGYANRFPAYLEPLRDRIPWEENGFRLRDDYSIAWDAPRGLRMYAQNGARAVRGVADPNLSLMAWRSATIINSILGRQVYCVAPPSSALSWRHGEHTEEYVMEVHGG